MRWESRVGSWGLLTASHLGMKDIPSFVPGLTVGLAHFVTSTQDAVGLLVHFKSPALTDVLHPEASRSSPCPQTPSYAGRLEVGSGGRREHQWVPCVVAVLSVQVGDPTPPATGVIAVVIPAETLRLRDADNLPKSCTSIHR